jgi:toxin ParE1/3/4
MAIARVHTTPGARRDIESCADYLVDHGSVEVALRFLESVEVTLNLLAGRPGFGRALQLRNPELEGLRVYRVQGFDNHLVFYLPREAGIDVVRVLHGARDLDAVIDGAAPAGE